MLREAEVGKTWEGEPRGSQDWGDDEVAVVPPVRPEVVPSLPEAEMIPLPMISQTLQKYVPGDVLGALRAEERSLGLVAEPPPPRSGLLGQPGHGVLPAWVAATTNAGAESPSIAALPQVGQLGHQHCRRH